MPDDFRFFLAANSPNGFFSSFNEFTNDSSIKKIYIIKGGPGCGKSTFMTRVAENAVSRGQTAELIHCSSDPRSLDGVILRPCGVAIVDGTAPHITEPRFPAAFETYINFADFWNEDGIRRNLNDIQRLTNAISANYKKTYSFIKAARCVSDAAFDSALPLVDIERLSKRASGIIRREIPKKSSAERGSVKKRFLSAISSPASLCLFDTVDALAKRVFVLDDTYGFSHFMLSPIADAAVNAGYDAYVCICPLNPEHKIDHVIIPELSLAFITSNRFMKYGGDPYRRIRVDAYISRASDKLTRKRLKLWLRMFSGMLESAGDSLKEAKAMHDELETLYSPHIDFAAIGKKVTDLSEKLF